jgi:signal peptidase I
VRDIILIIAVFILFGVFVAQPVVVEGTSMLPQLHDGERLLVNKLVYYKIQKRQLGTSRARRHRRFLVSERPGQKLRQARHRLAGRNRSKCATAKF